jgi:hypothetical protein
MKKLLDVNFNRAGFRGLLDIFGDVNDISLRSRFCYAIINAMDNQRSVYATLITIKEFSNCLN